MPPACCLASEYSIGNTPRNADRRKNSCGEIVLGDRTVAGLPARLWTPAIKGQDFESLVRAEGNSIKVCTWDLEDQSHDVQKSCQPPIRDFPLSA
jgi:hypothetical protein